MLREQSPLIQALPTAYNGIRFRSRLEARWAIFFDECGFSWEYEPEGYQMANGECYLPDFLLHDLVGRVKGDLFVEVKGKLTEEDAMKINAFIDWKSGIPTNSLLLAGNIFAHGSDESYIDRVVNMCSEVICPGHLEFFSHFTIDGDLSWPAILAVNVQGRGEVFGVDGDYSYRVRACNIDKTEAAFQTALNVQFSRHGMYMRKGTEK